MGAVTSPKKFLVATAALVALRAATALLTAGHDARPSPSRQPFGGGRRSSPKLEASRQPFSELDKLRARRLALRRRVPEPEADVAAAAENQGDDAGDIDHAVLTAGLEYLYEAGEERHSDDLFHLILMPSTFREDRMSVKHAAESCADVLGISSDKAWDVSLFAKCQSFCCLGTWTREECLSLGEELRTRSLDCRVIPFNGGGVIGPDSLPEIRVTDTTKPAARDAYLLSLGG